MKVIAGVDGSKYARWAIEWIAQFPFASAPQLMVLHVVDIDALHAPFMAQRIAIGNRHFLQTEIRRLEVSGRQVAAETKTLLTSLGLKAQVVIERGAIASSILREAKGRDDMVVIGSRGLDSFDRFMLGSVSTKVVLNASCSALVVKVAPRPLRRVVLGVDGSKSSENALQFLLRKMRSARINPDKGEKKKGQAILVTVVHVMPSPRYSEVKETGNALVHSCANRLAVAGYEVEEALRFGKPAYEILDLARRHKADLIVAGAKGLGAIARFLIGSVSTKLMQHSSCSVLLVR